MIKKSALKGFRVMLLAKREITSDFYEDWKRRR